MRTFDSSPRRLKNSAIPDAALGESSAATSRSCAPTASETSASEPLADASGSLGQEERPAMRIGNQLKLKSPGRQEVDPSLSKVGPSARSWFAQDYYSAGSQVIDGCIQILYVQGNVVSTDITVARGLGALIRRCVLKDLEDGRPRATKEPDFGARGTWMNVQTINHPGASGIFEWPSRVQVLAAQHINKEVRCSIKIGDRDADVVQASQAWQAISSSFHSFTPSQPARQDRRSRTLAIKNDQYSRASQVAKLEGYPDERMPC